MNAHRQTVVGLFRNHEDAQRAFHDLRQAGFSNEQLGVMTRDNQRTATATGMTDEGHGSHAGEGAAAGLAAGAGVGALWGLGIVAGILPAIGPAIAGGALAAILSSAAAGAAAAGLAGALIGLGIPESEAKHYEEEVQAGRTLVTVHASDRYLEAVAVLERNGAYDVHSHQSSVPRTTESTTYETRSTSAYSDEWAGGTTQNPSQRAIDVPVDRDELTGEPFPDTPNTPPRIRRDTEGM